MRKIVPLMLTLLFLFSSACFAAYQPDPEKWELVISDDDTQLFWNKSTIQYSDDKNTAVFELCLIDLKTDKHCIWNSKITKQPRIIAELQDALTESDIQTILNSPSSAFYQKDPILIVPNCLNEALYEAAFEIKLPEFQSRMKNIVKRKEMMYFLDTASIQYSVDGNTATYWTILIFPELDLMQSIYSQINKRSKTSMPLYTALNADPPKPCSLEKQTPQKIRPDSNGETIFKIIFPE